MILCTRILTPIIVLLRTIIQIVQQVVRTVCEWVSTVVRTVREVVERVCQWLPWPLSALCRLVTRLIEVIETVWNWVCREVIERILRWVEVLIEYVYYILKWVCWVIDWVGRLPDLLLCLAGFEQTRYLRVCVKILTDGRGTPAVPPADVAGMLRDAAAIFRRCNIQLIVLSTELVRKEEFLDSTTCEFSGMFSDFFVWFSQRACSCCSAVTVYFVRSIKGASGCAYPGSDWVTVAAKDGDGTTVVQEIGHLADLWAHSSDPNNVMSDQPGGTRDQITRTQCCMIRTSRFARASGRIEVSESPLPAPLSPGFVRPSETPFKRRERGLKKQ